MFKTIFAIIGYILFIFIVLLALKFGIDKYEEHECLIWAQQYKQFEGFYFASWQLKQCENYNINIYTN